MSIYINLPWHSSKDPGNSRTHCHQKAAMTLIAASTCFHFCFLFPGGEGSTCKSATNGIPWIQLSGGPWDGFVISNLLGLASDEGFSRQWEHQENCLQQSRTCDSFLASMHLCERPCIKTSLQQMRQNPFWHGVTHVWAAEECCEHDLCDTFTWSRNLYRLLAYTASPKSHKRSIVASSNCFNPEANLVMLKTKTRLETFGAKRLKRWINDGLFQRFLQARMKSPRRIRSCLRNSLTDAKAWKRFIRWNIWKEAMKEIQKIRKNLCQSYLNVIITRCSCNVCLPFLDRNLAIVQQKITICGALVGIKIRHDQS